MSRSSILLLEKDDITLSHLKSLLSKTPFEVVAVASFREAFKKIKEIAPQLALIVLDFELATDDVEIFARLRRLDFERPLPIVLLGEVPLTKEEISSFHNSTGYAGYIYKGMPKDEILETLTFLATPKEERRAEPRVYFKSRAHVVFGHQNYMADLYTLSVAGAFLEMRDFFPKEGSIGEMTFNGSLREKKLIKVSIKAIRVRPFDSSVLHIHPPGVAVTFLNPSEDVVRQIKKIINFQIQEGKIFPVAKQSKS